MTVGESIVNWLYTFGNIEILPSVVIETDQLDAGVQSFGLYKEATKNVTPYVNGSSDVAEYYFLLVRQSSKTNAARISNQAWMESLERWIYQKNLNRELPMLDNNRDCYGVSVAVSGYMMSAEADTSSYQISIKINYTEGT